MHRMMALETVQIAGMIRMPVMHDVMNGDVPEIAGRQSARNGACGPKSQDQPGWKERYRAKRREAQPKRCADKCALLDMVIMVHVPDKWHVVKDEAVQPVLDKGPQR